MVVSLHNDKTPPLNDELKSFRISPIFPLLENWTFKPILNETIYFLSFNNAYRVLGRLSAKGSDELINATFFSVGLPSIILISENPSILVEFRNIISQKEYAYEEWTIQNSLIININYALNINNNSDNFNININNYNYDILPIPERALVDEFRISVQLLIVKLKSHMPSEFDKIVRLINGINGLISELIYLYELKGEIPDTLSEYNIEDLSDKKLNHILKNQIIDRIIQVNSALSYISTQAFSGATPILERRCLIRRNSLLGIGSCILALNRIANFIEKSFSKVSINSVIKDSMSIAAPLDGLDLLAKLEYASDNWSKISIDKLARTAPQEAPYFKLPYFSGRLGFRETEFSIAAAIQSISSGASLEWSLMTLTHEMLHGHVRNIITCIFYGSDDTKGENLVEHYFLTFNDKMDNNASSETLIDSIRNVFIAYCCLTISFGSLTLKRPVKWSTKTELYRLKSSSELLEILRVENRNISEIFVHILDLHYFYAGRVSVYIPLIWCSWVAIPYINEDLRQYILRSLLTISSKKDDTLSTHDRFTHSIEILKELLEKYKDNKLNNPTIYNVIEILNNKQLLNDDYFGAFKSSIILVDLIKKIFISGKVRASLFNDGLISWDNEEQNEDSFEAKFIYNLEDGFNDESIDSPTSYLLHKMIEELDSDVSEKDLERETALQFLALNSNV